MIIANVLHFNSGFQPFQYHQQINVWYLVYLSNSTHHFWQFFEPLLKMTLTSLIFLKGRFYANPVYGGWEQVKGQEVEPLFGVAEDQIRFRLLGQSYILTGPFKLSKPDPNYESWTVRILRPVPVTFFSITFRFGPEHLVFSGTVPETKSVFYLYKPLPSVIEPNILDTAVVFLSGLKNSFWGKGVQYNES